MQKKNSSIFFFLAFLLTLLFNFPMLASDGNKETKESKKAVFENHILSLYNSITFTNSRPDYNVFRKAYIGFLNLKAENKLSKDILTIIDFRLSSTKERFWSIDMATKKVLYESLVAHGRKSGEEFAKKFSNKLESHMSSFGFYVTGDIYTGKHGLSLYLDGMDTGYNSNARTRAVVMHSAEYVNQDFIKENGRLGRSLGCPAIPVANHEEVINTLMNKSCLFIYYPDVNYEKKSKLLSLNNALNYFSLNSLDAQTVTKL